MLCGGRPVARRSAIDGDPREVVGEATALRPVADPAPARRCGCSPAGERTNSATARPRASRSVDSLRLGYVFEGLRNSDNMKYRGEICALANLRASMTAGESQ